MAEISTRIEGRAGRITLTRPEALNALSYGMCTEVERAIDAWIDNNQVALIIIDAEGDRAFCAGGDISAIYHAGREGDYALGRDFWTDEYRMNAKMYHFPKPVVSFLQGFTMGGGVGLACHGSHRIVGDSSQISMPETGIGLIPDVGGSLLLARAPGRIGEYLGLTGARMGAGDAIFAGFADYYLPEDEWDALKAKLCESGDVSHIDAAALPEPDAPLIPHHPEIDAVFAGAGLSDIMQGIPADPSPFMEQTLKALEKASPLSLACTLEIVRRVRGGDTIVYALEQEYRFTYRACEQSDFLEGVRAAVIDKDRQPQWKHASWRDLPPSEVLAMTLPLGPNKLNLEELFA